MSNQPHDPMAAVTDNDVRELLAQYMVSYHDHAGPQYDVEKIIRDWLTERRQQATPAPLVQITPANIRRVADFLAGANIGKPFAQCSALQQLTFMEQAEYALRIGATPPPPTCYTTLDDLRIGPLAVE